MSLVHAVTGEQSRLRRASLYLFARYVEMPLLRWGYRLLRGELRAIGANPIVRGILRWSVAAPFGYLGDTARPWPAPEVLRLIDRLEGVIAVGPCRCRAAHGACQHPLETDLVIRTGVEAWTRAFPHDYRPISKEEAKSIVSACHDQGMWQMLFVHCPVEQHRSFHSRTPNRQAGGEQGPAASRAEDPPGLQGNEYVICNCCTCGCVPYILNRDLGQRAYPLLRGSYVAHTDFSRCSGHGACVEACPFSVRALVDGRGQLVAPCFGCGLCASACPEGAIVMQPAGRGDEGL
jgi:Pyruvate/2-oxoacid:ferredoxin oxidoreductase delta subunit